jgi:hypothetical protein
VEAAPAAPEVQPVGDAADKPVDSIEEASKAEGTGDDQAAVENSRDASERAGSAVVHPNEVGLYLSTSSLSQTLVLSSHHHKPGASSFCLARMNMIVAARASDRGVHLISPYALTNPVRALLLPRPLRLSDAAALLHKLWSRVQSRLQLMLAQMDRMQMLRTSV